MLKYKLRRISKSKLIIWSTLILLFFVSMGSIVNYYANSVDFEGQNSGIVGDTVYINDFVSDFDYYTSLNYTEITSRDSLPEYREKYNKDSLVAVQLTYDGHDVNNNDLFGFVSVDEKQTKFVYYKYYPIVDGKIKIELIDNPYTARPTGYGFNGWVCDNKNEGSIPCESLTFSFDSDYYTRYLTIPAPEADANGDRKLIVNLKASWAEATIYELKGKTSLSISSAINNENNIKERGMYSEFINQNDSNYYIKDLNNKLDELTSMTGYYYKIELEEEYDSSNPDLYYNNLGINCKNTSCSIEEGLYKLIQSNDAQSHIITKNDDGTYITNYDINRYYYLSTRDTNICEAAVADIPLNFVFSTSIRKEFTFTFFHDGETRNTSNFLKIGNDVFINNDVVLENVIIGNENNYTIYANGHNVKIGRNVRTKKEGSYTCRGIFSGIKSNNQTNKKNKVLVESGYYNNLYFGSGLDNINNTNFISQYGSDYDRVLGSDKGNLKLIVESAISSSDSKKSSSEGIIPNTSVTIKSGTYGNDVFKNGIVVNDYYTYGVYASNSSNYHSKSLGILKIEGGKIFNVNGGVDVDSSEENRNSIGIYITGGDIQNVSGGGAIDSTYGNRIVSVSGGTIHNAVSGGSNSSVGSGSDKGPLFGSSLVYVGGSAKIGGTPFVDNLYSVSKVGSVFGAGLGRENEQSNLGHVSNSKVIINGGTITGDVYGGGNFGAVGYSKDKYGVATTEIYIKDGNIAGSVYGAANSNGFSKLNYRTDSLIKIDVSGGNIEGGVYGGSNSSGDVYGQVQINLIGGKIAGNIYGAGYGKNTSVIGDITINSVANLSSNSIYGGSSFGRVGSETFVEQRYTSTININGGKVHSVYGGSEGSESDATIVPNIYGNAIVNANGGSIDTIYGANNIRGSVSGTTEVNVNSGNVGTVYGGSHGKNASSKDTKVNINGGTIDTVYGGGEEAFSETTSVIAKGGEITCNIYGGGKSADANTTNVELNGTIFTTQIDESVGIDNSECGNIFGGGESANVIETNVNVNSGSVLNVYGGSNKKGGVSATKIDINSGSIVNVFGGNNKDGSVEKTEINIINGQITGDVFGGGNQAPVYGSTIVNMYGGTANSVYGGGNKSFIGKALIKDNGELDEENTNSSIDSREGMTEVNIIGGNINKNVYGSGNASFVYGNTLLNIGSSALNEEDEKVNKDITIGGSVFGGSETNANEDNIYNYSSIGVSGSATINIDGSDYVLDDISTLRIKGSIYGSGNNSNTSGNKVLNISNYGTKTSLVSSLSLQRFNKVYLTDSNFELIGDRDRASGNNYIYSLIRVDELYLLGSESENNLTGTSLYIKSGSTFLSTWYSGTLENGKFVPQETIEVDNKLVNKKSNNKLYMFTNKLLSVSKTEFPDREFSGPGQINGMTFLGMYSINRDGEYKTGVYGDYITGNIIDKSKNEEISSVDYTYVFGARNTKQSYQEQIKTNGFYTNVSIGDSNGEEYVIRQKYVDVTPKNDTTNYYEWRIGDVPPEIDVPLIASRYSVKGVSSASLSIDALREKIGDEDLEWRDATMEIFEVKTDDFKAESPNVKEAYDLYLVDKSEIGTYNLDNKDENSEKPGNSVIDANQYFALSLGTTSTGWLDNYNTSIYNEGYTKLDGNDIYGDDFCTIGDGGDCVGNNLYLYDSTRNQRSLSFYLHHSKNLDFSVAGITDTEILSVSLGKVIIYAKFTNPHADPTDAKGSVIVSFNVNISMEDGDKDAYGSSIAPGKKYDVFQNSIPAITTDSSFSIYQSLYLDMNAKKLGSTSDETWSVEEVYGEGNYRALRSSYNFPVGTRITMLDLAYKEQYFYDVDGSDHRIADELYQYKLSDFYKMGNETKKIKYDDDMNGRKSTKYYHTEEVNGTTMEIGTEEFVFIIDFSNVEDDEHKNKNNVSYYLSMALLKADGSIILETQKDPKAEMIYNLYSYTKAELKTDGGFIIDENKKSKSASIYAKQKIDLELDTVVKVFNNDAETSAITTIFDDYKLGANIKISRAKTDEEGNIIMEDGSIVYEDIPENDNLLGLVLSVNKENFYPQKDHSIRVKLAGRVTGLTSMVNFDFSNSNLKPGKYKIDVETFASYDGLYYGDSEVSHSSYELTLLNDEYGLDVNVEDSSQMTHDVNSGQDKNGNNVITYKIQTKNGLANPNLKVSLQRRDDESYSLQFIEKNLSDIATGYSFNNVEMNDLSTACIDNSCYVGEVNKDIVVQDSEFKLVLKSGPSEEDRNNPSEALWKSGTYRIVFTMYDGETPIGSVYEYLIIRDLGVERSGS